MLLYHFTTVNKLPSIKRQGLLPQPGDHMTSGLERLWLTAQPDLSLTKREAQWLADHGGIDNRIPFFEKGRLRLIPPKAWLSTDRWVGGLGRPMSFVRGEPQARLTVRIRKNDSSLHRYAIWRGRPRGQGFDLRSLPYARLWYVYQGAIAPDRIIEIVDVDAGGCEQLWRSAA